jgi:hypothetical protein
MGAHDRDDDPITVLHVLRRTALALMGCLMVIGLCLLAAGLALDTIELWNLGCTMSLGAPPCAIIASGAWFCELSQRGIQQTRQEVQENSTRLDALEVRERENSIRLDAIEAGERAIAEAIRSADDEDGDELRRRREG